MDALHSLRSRLRALASPETAAGAQRFFKTGAGQYGAGDVFLGIRVPLLRALAGRQRDTTLATIAALLASEYHEERLFALLLLIQFYQRADAKGRQAAYDCYLGNTARINNWDLVDVSAPHIVGRHLELRPRAILRKLAQSGLLWERRIAIVATLHFIRRDEFADTLAVAAMLLEDPHDLIHKATGWMLREVGKRDAAVLESFLGAHHAAMPRTMLRYAIERLPPERRRHYLQGKRGLA